MQPNNFRYSLKIDGVTTELFHAPIGWEDSLIKWGRETFYFGMIRTFSVPLKFVKEGATLLRKEFYSSGIEGNATLTIDKLNKSTWVYEQLYIGDVDFSNFKDGENEVEVNIMEGGISKQIKAYENVKYEINMDVPEALDILINGIILRETATLFFTPQIDDPKGDYFPPVQVLVNEQKSNQVSVQDVDGFQQSNPNYATSDKWFYKAQVTGSVNLKGFLAGLATSPNAGKRYQINLIKSTGALIETIVDVIPEQYQSIYFNEPFDINVDMLAGEKLFIYEDSVGSLQSQSGILISDSEMFVSYNTISEPSHCKALRPKYVFDQLIKKMNGGAPYPTQSFILKEWEQLCLTSGDAIRQIEGAKLKTSFKDFFTSINSLVNVGFGPANGKAVLEAKSYFFQPTLTTIDVGEIKDFHLEPYTQVIYNTIKAGYPDTSYDEINGRDEYNSTQNYSTPITRIQKELNLVSAYRADSYGIEFLRINLEGKKSTDSSSDNDVFFIKVKSAPEAEGYFLPETAEVYSAVSGVQSGSTAYNMDISPKKNLLRHGDYLHGMLDRLDGRFINFESALKNKELVTTRDGKKIAEKAGINISSLPDKLFLPYVVSFTAKLPRTTMQMINSFPTGCVKFIYRKVEISGFIIDVSVDVSNNEQQQLRLLLSPKTNLLTFIH